MKSVLPDDTHLKLHPIRFLKASSFADGAREITANAVSRCARCSPWTPIVRYLDSLPYAVEANCDEGHYYMLNNTNPGFLPNGVIDTNGIKSGGSIPPSSVLAVGTDRDVMPTA